MTHSTNPADSPQLALLGYVKCACHAPTSQTQLHSSQVIGLLSDHMCSCGMNIVGLLNGGLRVRRAAIPEAPLYAENSQAIGSSCRTLLLRASAPKLAPPPGGAEACGGE